MWNCEYRCWIIPEWRFYGADDKNAKDPSRCGPINPLLVESSFGCKVLCNSKSSYEMRRIRKWTSGNQCLTRKSQMMNSSLLP